jgi:hypothetical protein
MGKFFVWKTVVWGVVVQTYVTPFQGFVRVWQSANPGRRDPADRLPWAGMSCPVGANFNMSEKMGMSHGI